MRHPKTKAAKYNRKDQRNRHKRELLIEPFLGRRITINATVDTKSVVTGDILHAGEPTSTASGLLSFWLRFRMDPK